MEIRVETPRPHIVLVTIANEKRRNAMTRAMLADLAALWDRLDQDADCRCVVLTGAGEKAFSAGADISGDLSASAETAHVINRALLKDTPFAKPIVAAINGDCVGGGLELLLSTDIRAAIPEARFGLPEVRWSIYPFGGATVKLAHQIGHVHAMDLLLTGRLVDAAFAERVGLVNTVVERDRLMPWALETAAAREVMEETGIEPSGGRLARWNAVYSFEIYAQWRHRFAPGTVYNTEHVFGLALRERRAVKLAPREHVAYEWLAWDRAAPRCFSWSNRDAIHMLGERAVIA